MRAPRSQSHSEPEPAFQFGENEYVAEELGIRIMLLGIGKEARLSPNGHDEKLSDKNAAMIGGAALEALGVSPEASSETFTSTKASTSPPSGLLHGPGGWRQEQRAVPN